MEHPRMMGTAGWFFALTLGAGNVMAQQTNTPPIATTTSAATSSVVNIPEFKNELQKHIQNQRPKWKEEDIKKLVHLLFEVLPLCLGERFPRSKIGQSPAEIFDGKRPSFRLNRGVHPCQTGFKRLTEKLCCLWR